MTDKKVIGTIAHLGFIWGLEELRTTLKDDQALADEIKIMYIPTDSAPSTKLRHYAAKLAGLEGIKKEGFTTRDPPITKIKILLENFNVKAEHENGIFVACNGSGGLNSNVQNNALLFRDAIKAAENIHTSEEVNYAVFIDSDVKQILTGALSQYLQQSTDAAKQTSPESFSEDELEAYESQNRESRERDPARRFALLHQSTKKLQNFFGSFSSVAPNQKTVYLKKMEKMIDLHEISTSRAHDSYEELRDNKNAEKKALEARLAKKEEVLNNFLDQMNEREEQHREELDAKEKSKAEAEQKIRAIKDENNEVEKQAEILTLEEQVKSYQTEIKNLTDAFNERERTSLEVKSNLVDEKDALNLELDKKILELNRLEKNYADSIKKAEALAKELERENITPAKLYQERANVSPSPSLTFGQNRTSKNSVLIQETPAMPRPKACDLEEAIDDGPRTQRKSQAQTTNRRPIICKPANFGLNTWNPDTTDIYVHLDKAVKAGKEAVNVGATETSVRRMILNSLGTNCDHVENFIEDADSMSLEKFAESIGKILGKKSSVQMQSFLTAQRRSGEDLLAYYTRLHMLYRSSNKLTENKNWENDATHSMSFYSKIFDACYQAQKAELIRKTEEHLEQGNLTLPKLKGILVEVNKIDSTKRNAEEPTHEIAVLEDNNKYNYNPTYKINPKTASQKPWYTNKEKTEKEGVATEKRKDGRNKKPIVCWYCAIPGHTKAECYRYLKKMKEEKGEPRETKTRGNQQRNYSQHQ